MVTWNTDITKNDGERYGEKAAVLADLAANGYSVPAFYTVSTAQVEDVFKTAVSQTLRDKLDEAEDWDTIQTLATKVQTRIRDADLPVDLAQHIQDAYTDIGLSKAVRNAESEAKDLVTQRDFEFVAVRPSTTSRVHGLAPPRLCVNGKDDVVDAVKQIIANFYAADSIYYRKHNSDARLGVMVQRMLTPEVSIAVHTNADQVIVEAVPGFGDTLRNGSLTPDRYVIDGDTGELLQKTISVQSWEKTQDPMTGRLTQNTRPGEKHGEPLLDMEALEEAVSLARKITSTHQVNQVDLSFYGSKLHILDAYATPPLPGHTPAPQAEGGDAVHGVPATTGTGTGTVTHQPRTADDEYIYVTEDATPQYTPFHHHLTAAVTEKGGVTSHLATLCREKNIPLLVNVSNAAAQLAPDTHVTVNTDNAAVTETTTTTPPEKSVDSGDALLPATKLYVENPDNSITVDGVYLSKPENWDTSPNHPVWNSTGNGPGQVVVNAENIDPAQARGRPVLFQTLSAFKKLAAFADHGASAFILDIPRLEEEAHDPAYVSQAVQHATAHATDQTVAIRINTLDTTRLEEAVRNGVTTVITPEEILPRLQPRLHRIEQQYVLDTVRDKQ